MEVERAFHIAKREWGNIRSSLRTCGDIGEFNFTNLVNNGAESLSLFRNIIEMENKLPIYSYSTPEAAYVFATLASIAGKRLGLTDSMARKFGGGYSWVRTNWFGVSYTEKQKEQEALKQLLFYKLFFPFGVSSSVWDFESPLVMTKFKLVFDTFMNWQYSPESYMQDIRDYGAELNSLWNVLSLTGNFTVEFPEF